MTRANQPFQIDRRNGYISFSDTHLNLQLIDNLIGDFNDLFKHIDLILVTDDIDFCTLEEEISGASMSITIYLGTNFLK